MRITKTATYLYKAGTMAVLTGIPLLYSPSPALAADATTPTGVIGEAAKRSHGDEGETLSANTLGEKIRAIAAWLLGLAVVIFVLKVVLTAVDRILNDRESSVDSHRGNTYYFHNSFLVSIPIIGAYPPPERDGYNHTENGYTWKKVWANFAVQLVIAVGAWMMIELIVGLLSGVLGKLN